jgi:predicted GNAT family N-acyltransferase
MNPIAEGFFVEPADATVDQPSIQSLREQVFVHELGSGSEVIWDARDADAGHVLARDPHGQPIGCGRLTADGAIGRLAVLPDWRRRGVGRALLMRLIDLGRQRRLPALHVNAGAKAGDFYATHGFAASGECVKEAGISHQVMRLPLDQAPPLERSVPPPGAESPEIELDGVEACRDALLILLGDARRQLCIFSRALDPELFSGAALLQALRRVATAGRGAEVRILVQDPETALHDGAPLLALAQRLSSSVPLRQPSEDTEAPFAGAYVLNDSGGLLFRPIGSRFEGSFRRHAPGHHRQLLEQFRQAWDRAEPAAILRAQSL